MAELGWSRNPDLQFSLYRSLQAAAGQAPSHFRATLAQSPQPGRPSANTWGAMERIKFAGPALEGSISRGCTLRSRLACFQRASAAAGAEAAIAPEAGINLPGGHTNTAHTQQHVNTHLATRLRLQKQLLCCALLPVQKGLRCWWKRPMLTGLAEVGGSSLLPG